VCGAKCDLSTRFDGKAGWYTVAVQYFDQSSGASRFQLLVGCQVVGQWLADDTLPSAKVNAHTSTRYTSASLMLRPGDQVRVVGIPDSGEQAAIDYLEIKPAAAGSY